MAAPTDRRARVLAALHSHPKGVSGEALAASFGVSRAAVAKHVAALRCAGYDIAAAPGLGYRLISTPDAPLPDEVSPLLDSPLWMRLEGGGETGSTNDDAKALAREGAPEGTAVLATAQRTGRGRLGRRWSSPRGGLYCSVVFRPALAPAQIAPLSLAIGVGVARTLDRFGVHTLLKWPNDVLLASASGGRGKVAGILVEMSAESDRVEWVVVGVGVNVRPAPDAAGAKTSGESQAAYMADAVEPPSLAGLAAALLDELAVAYEQFRASGFAGVSKDWAARDALAGVPVTVRDALGRVVAGGVAAGIDADGRLLVRAQSGTVSAAASGEVTLATRP